MTAHRLVLVMRCGVHELRCTECRVTWKSWAQRLAGIKAGYSPKVPRIDGSGGDDGAG